MVRFCVKLKVTIIVIATGKDVIVGREVLSNDRWTPSIQKYPFSDITPKSKVTGFVVVQC